MTCLTTPAVGRPGDGLLPVPLTRCIPMHTPSPWDLEGGGLGPVLASGGAGVSCSRPQNCRRRAYGMSGGRGGGRGGYRRDRGVGGGGGQWGTKYETPT